MTQAREPLGPTYRLQLNGLGLARATQLVSYLAGLGVRTLYLSPITTAATGSSHGYDVVDPTRLDPALGTKEALGSLLEEVDAHAMRILLDIVPNHMAATEENRWWYDVQRNGIGSAFARFFDIDWETGEGRVVLPVLARSLADTVQAGELRLEPGDPGTETTLVYETTHFPLSAATAKFVGTDQSVVDRINNSASELRDLIDAQHYRLAHWRVAPYEVNYRRFFDIDGLVGIRVEDREVYDATHRFVLELASDHRVAGVRVDHVDGLADPEHYLDRLRSDLPDSCNIVVEKVLARGEEIRSSWQADGSTGYEFADNVFALFTDARGAGLLALDERGDVPNVPQMEVRACRQILERSFPGAISRLATRVSEMSAGQRHWHDVPSEAMHVALSELVAHMPVYRTYAVNRSEEEANQRVMVDALSGAHVDAGDELTHRALEIIREVLTDRPADGERKLQSGSDLRIRFEQLTSAVSAKGVEDTALYRYCGLLSTADVGSNPSDPPVTPDEFHLAMKERLHSHPGSLNATSTHDSKRNEDLRSRLAVLSEVPQSWVALQTTWRARHRVMALSCFDETRGVPPEVETSVYQTVAGLWPMHSEWPPESTVRVRDYALKAARESKLHTSWTDPDDTFESGLLQFVDAILDDSNSQFRLEMQELVRQIAPAAMVNSLAAVVLKATAPGVGDFYQGCEEWRPLLVDPDNRAPVDFARLEEVLNSMPSTVQVAAARELLGRWYDGAIKTYVLRGALLARKKRESLFAKGEYAGLATIGAFADHVVAFTRYDGSDAALIVVPRLCFSLAGPGGMPVGELWSDTKVIVPNPRAAEFYDVFTGKQLRASTDASTGDEHLAVADILSDLPVSVLFQS
jgi:(1->4)-alpha-D-glucan 1-alpha-D-glucosylmutase